MENGGSDSDAVWHDRSDGSTDKAGSGFLGIGQREGVILRANMGRAIVTNGDFLLLEIPIAPQRGCCLVNS